MSCHYFLGILLYYSIVVQHINDLLKFDLASAPRLYANDTCLTITSCDPIDHQSKLNNDLSKIQSWLQANKLSLNVKSRPQHTWKHMRMAELGERHLTWQEIKLLHKIGLGGGKLLARQPSGRPMDGHFLARQVFGWPVWGCCCTILL